MSAARDVRYHYLRPDEIVAARNACPVCYIPIGTLEWHGPHLPTGSDAFQAEALAIRAAELGGGLAFPPLWFGESRLESLMEAVADDREAIAREMDLSPDNFTQSMMPFTAMEQTTHYVDLLMHILAEAMSLGFKVGVLVAGHYPLIDHARAATLRFNKWRGSKTGGLLAWACLDYLPLIGQYPEPGDHASAWETSHMLHIMPERVDLSALPADGTPVVGIMGSIPPRMGTAEQGRETLEKSAVWVAAEAAKRLENPAFYRKHGMSLHEG